AIYRWDITRTNSETVRNFYRAAPGCIPTQVAFSQEARCDDLDTDRENVVIRSVEHPFSKDGGTAHGDIERHGILEGLL
ncbi:dihydroxy-acid dehydratase, partial [Rhizobium ruizarguesonis]